MERAPPAILPSSQELICPQPTSLPTPSHRMGSERLQELGFFKHSVPSWAAKQITLCSQISEWKNGKLNSLRTFLICGGVLVVFLGYISAKHVCFWFFFRISDIYICSPFKCKCFKVGNLRVSTPDIWCRPHSLPPSVHPLSLFSYSCIGSNKWLLFKYGSRVVVWRCGSYPPSLIWSQTSASSSTWVSERAGRKGLFSKHSWSLTFCKQPQGGGGCGDERMYPVPSLNPFRFCAFLLSRAPVCSKWLEE